MQGSEEERYASIEILQRIASFIRSLTPEEVEDLIHGRAKLVLGTRDARKRTNHRDLPAETIPDVLRTLRNLPTREAGASYLQEVAPTRASLAQIAVAMDVPVPKSDTVAKLRERIIEAAIGYRLRSDAVRGKNSTTE